MKINTFIVILFAPALPCALIAQTATPSPAELIAHAVAAEKAQDEKNSKYTYREDHAQSQVDKDGKAGPSVTRTYDHIMLEGEEYKKLVLIDGKPLDAKTQKRVNEDMEKERAERRTRGLLHGTRTVRVPGVDKLEQFFNNKVTGEETVLGRRTWRMESEPKPDYKPTEKKDQEFLSARHISWFDQQDGQRIKWQDVFIRPANSFQPGTTFDWELTRIGDEWLLDSIVVRMDMKIVLGIHGRAESHQRFYDYKRFTVDSMFTPQ